MFLHAVRLTVAIHSLLNRGVLNHTSFALNLVIGLKQINCKIARLETIISKKSVFGFDGISASVSKIGVFRNDSSIVRFT